MTIEERDSRIAEIETLMMGSDFWSKPNEAQALIKELQELKDYVPGQGKYDSGGAVMMLFAGAGGDDAEDFVAMLFGMYRTYIERRGWTIYLLDENKNDHKGYRSLSFEIIGKHVYGTLKRESGVHRLVRISPFNSGGKRQTSFAMVEVIPRFEKTMEVDVPDSDLKIEFTRSGGPGGQNVNKRETAVRILHIPTKIAVRVDSERNQAQNKDKALEILKSKLYAIMEETKQKEESASYVSKTVEAEWGSQIRSYVLHPYKLVKDHRTNVETSNTDKILEDGEIDEFLEAERNL